MVSFKLQLVPYGYVELLHQFTGQTIHVAFCFLPCTCCVFTYNFAGTLFCIAPQLLHYISFCINLLMIFVTYFNLIICVSADAEIVWCQEEPMNMGAYSYITPRLYTAMRMLGRGTFEDIKYVGRAPSAATATGFYSVHVQEQTGLVQKAMQPDPINHSH